MAKAKAKGKHRLDKFYRLAKEQGWRSRAAFKLVQLDRKYRFLDTAKCLVDLCAAPGGWMQIAVKSMPVGSTVIGVDLVPIRPVRGALTLQEDITTPKCASSIHKLLKQRGHTLVDVVLHDGSPNVGGAWAKEATNQAGLVLDALKLATKFLAPKGTFVTKVFRSQDYNSLLYALKQLFEKVEVTKPMASRSTSAEIYVIGLKYLAPAKIDARLLDARHLFQEIAEAPKVVDVLGKSKQKRHREGYDPNTTFQNDCTAAEFFAAAKPLEKLGTITSVSFDDPESAAIRDHPATTDEIKALCEDFLVLGKKEFKQILKWCLHVRKELSTQKEVAHVVQEVKKGAEEDKDEEEEEEDLLEKMEEMKTIIDLKRKNEKKKAARRKQKTKARTATGMQVDVMGDQYGEIDLFSLASIKAKKDLERVEDAVEEDIPSDEEQVKKISEDEEDSDVDVARERYYAELDTYFDRAYENYCKAKEGSRVHRKRARMKNADNENELWEEKNADEAEENEGDEGDDEVSEEEANPLVVSVPKPKFTKEEVANQWFSQEIFLGFEEKVDEKKQEQEVKIKPIKAAVIEAAEKIAEPEKIMKDNAEFEVVAKEESDSSSSSDEDDDEQYDSDDKAEILAYAKKMLHKKSRDDLIDDSYNRYMFDDDELPEWFKDDESKHNHIMKPYTKEEIMAMKAQFKAIDARPVKKVAEAKARKARRTMKRMEQARHKANSISDQTEISARSKGKMIDKLYKKASATQERKPQVVVAKKGGRGRGGKGKIVVDRRMKKDVRSHGSGKPGFKKKGNNVKMKRSGVKGGGIGGRSKAGKKSKSSFSSSSKSSGKGKKRKGKGM